MDYFLSQPDSKKGQWRTTSQEEIDLAEKLKHKSLKEEFPGVSDELLEAIYEANQKDVNQTKQALKTLFQEPKLPPKPRTVPSEPPKNQKPVVPAPVTKPNESPVPKPPPSQPNEPSEEEFTFITRKKKKREFKPKNETEFRKEASQLVHLKNEYFRAATNAYLHGDGALAKQLSERGKHFSHLLKESHKRACAETYVNNTYRIDNVLTVDFHGVFVKEALEILEQVLLQDCGVKMLRLITGVGKHSEGGKAKIKPAIEEFLRQRGLHFTEPRPGVLTVTLNKNHFDDS